MRRIALLFAVCLLAVGCTMPHYVVRASYNAEAARAADGTVAVQLEVTP